MGSSSGRNARHRLALAAHHEASVPSMAFFTPPETGASTSGMPSFARSADSSRVPTGEDELMSMTTEPAAR